VDISGGVRHLEHMTKTQEAMNIRNEIQKALRGEPSKATVYWDRQDETNEGPAFRCGQESGPLDLSGWMSGGRHVTDERGYDLSAYFNRDGSYKGPDCYGVFPNLE
jgi:hypothetical protein